MSGGGSSSLAPPSLVHSLKLEFRGHEGLSRTVLLTLQSCLLPAVRAFACTVGLKEGCLSYGLRDDAFVGVNPAERGHGGFRG
jgi:hypothetical protein